MAETPTPTTTTSHRSTLVDNYHRDGTPFTPPGQKQSVARARLVGSQLQWRRIPKNYPPKS